MRGEISNLFYFPIILSNCMIAKVLVSGIKGCLVRSSKEERVISMVKDSRFSGLVIACLTSTAGDCLRCLYFDN